MSRLSLAQPALRRLFPADVFTIGPLGHDPVLGAYRYISATDGPAARTAAHAARAAGYAATLQPSTARLLVILSAR